jgi:hypothetical protein
MSNLARGRNFGSSSRGRCLSFYRGHGPPSPHRLGEGVAGLPQERPRRGTAIMLQLSVDIIHDAGRRWSTRVVEGLLTSLPGKLCRPPRPLQERSNRHAALYRYVRGCRLSVAVSWMLCSSFCRHCFLLVLSCPKARGRALEKQTWSSSSWGTPREGCFVSLYC